MTDTELFTTLALLRVEGVGDIMAKKLINHCGSAEEIFKAKKGAVTAIDGVGEIAWKNLQNAGIFKQAEAEMKFIQQEGIR